MTKKLDRYKERLDLNITFGQNVAHVYTQLFIKAISLKPYAEANTLLQRLCSLDVASSEKFTLLEDVVGYSYKELCTNTVPIWFMFSRNATCSLMLDLLRHSASSYLSYLDLEKCLDLLPNRVLDRNQYCISTKRSPYSEYAHIEIGNTNPFIHSSFICLNEENCKELYDYAYTEKTILSSILDFSTSQNIKEN